jgi:hypothetical protein
MSIDLQAIARNVNSYTLFEQQFRKAGFASPADVNRFIFSGYGEAIRNIAFASRPRGSMFILEPAVDPLALSDPVALKGAVLQIVHSTSTSLHSLCCDLAGGLTEIHQFSAEEQKFLSDGIWTSQIAQQYSKHLDKCIVWIVGVAVQVYICGDCYLETPDAIEKIRTGIPGSFQTLSWDDGRIFYEFAAKELNDRGRLGVWQIPDKHLLKPKPELLIGQNLIRFLQFRMAGYKTHYSEAEVEHLGQADISIHLIDARVFIVEIKWLGQSLSSTRSHEKADDILAALGKKSAGWFTTFDESTIPAAAKQLSTYYESGKYHRAHLAVFDCRQSAQGQPSEQLPMPDGCLGDNDNLADFRIHKACVDNRTASVQSKHNKK